MVLSGGEEYRVEGKVSVEFQMKGKRLLFRDVYCVPDLHKNYSLLIGLRSIAHI